MEGGRGRTLEDSHYLDVPPGPRVHCLHGERSVGGCEGIERVKEMVTAAGGAWSWERAKLLTILRRARAETLTFLK